MKTSREQASEGNFNLFTKPGVFVRIRHHSLARRGGFAAINI